jgi:hypothetical protein
VTGDGRASGRVGVTLRIGITGHRRLSDLDALTAALDESLDRFLATLPTHDLANTPVSLCVISALAEGADRLGVESLLERGAELEVVLPLDPDDYRQDFESPESSAEFDRLRGQAQRESVMPEAPSRNEAYLACGQQIVDRSDVVVAVWDGRPARGPGGTGDIVEYARERLVPLIWLSSDGRHRVTPMIGEDVVLWDSLNPLGASAWRQLEQYNHPLHHPEQLTEVTGSLRRSVHQSQDILGIEEATSWIAPYFGRADLQANYFERWYKRAGVALFTLSFLAVLTVAAQELFLSRDPWIVWFEVVFLAVIFVGIFFARRVQLHERWITARYLGESFRSAMFLALVGIGQGEDHPAIRIPDDDPTDAWVRRAFAEVWHRRPDYRRSEGEVGPLQRFLADMWLGGQVTYFAGAARHHGRVHDRLTWLAYFFFGISAAAAVLHSLNVAHGRAGTFAWWGFLSIVVPAAAAAVSGLTAQREYQQHAKRYERMTRQLTDLRVRMEAADDLQELQRLALETERRLREETGEWFGVVRLHALELPA